MPAKERIGTEGVVSAGDRVCVFPAMTAMLAPGASETGVLETVMAGEPGIRVWPWILIAEFVFAVYVEPEIVKAGFSVGVLGLSYFLLPPTTAMDALRASDMGVLEMVMAGEPGIRVWPCITIAELEFAVYVLPANVN